MEETSTTRRHRPASTGTRSGTVTRCFLLISLAVLWQAAVVMGQNGTDAGPNVTGPIIGSFSLAPTESPGGNVPPVASLATLAPTESPGGNVPPVASLLPAEPTLSPTMADTDVVSTLIPTATDPVPIDTMEPTVATASPTVAPVTAMPVFTPTGSPTVGTPAPTNATLAPSSAPTNATLAPTVPQATGTPTMKPTNATMAPTVPQATGTPTMSPTNATMAPTVPEATGTPTMSPTIATMAPTNATAPPATAPTAAPTVIETTAAPTTLNITEAPSATGDTLSPTTPNVTTTAPTTMDTTAAPTMEGNVSAPTAAPSGTSAPTVVTGTEVTDTVKNLEMTLVGLNQVMGLDASQEWKVVTEDHTKDYYSGNPQLQITNVETTVTLTAQSIVPARRLRHQEDHHRQLQASVTIQYDQEITYRTQNEDRDTAEQIVLGPFQTPADLDAYLAELKSASTEFEDVTGVEPVEVGDGGGSNPVVPPEEEKDDGGLSTGAIIGIVCGSVAGVAAIVGVGYYVSQRGDDGGYVSTGKTPPSQLDVRDGNDEVSTLAEPLGNNRASVNNAMSGESIQGYGDQSVATVDYDYSKAYGGGGDTSVSSAGGTFGSQTHTQAAGGAATLGGATGAGNGGPLDTNFSEGGSQFRGQNANVREELIDIYAPPGKLGVVIDTPDDGAPVVHAVKDSSVIADKLQVGDKLVAVDDEDVRSMTAIKVSKLISRKSANASRKLSIIRTVVVDE